MNTNMDAINKKVEQESGFVKKLFSGIEEVIVGQRYLLERLLIGIMANGHILVESVPGLAKTLSISTLAKLINAKFHRLQFTPDLLPSDIIGTLMYNPKDGAFVTKKGPIFANIILADEINRAPAKVQSALLEAMQERQVTIGEESFKLDEPFLVMATQNPIEQEGTYNLPEAQIDRFMLKVNITYPKKDEELKILQRMAETDKKIDVSPVVQPAEIIKARAVVNEVYLDEKLQRYIVDIVYATRKPADYNLKDIVLFLRYGASPRASIGLALAAKAYAFINGRGYVTPQDIKDIAPDILRHRILLSYEAEAQGRTQDEIVARLLEEVKVP
ncbi:MAG: MoxR family ATPase [Dehalococcoidia bacterium]|nr:MAG: MoxR family ATPase [Dehalococcoidia bacterium]